MDYVNEYLKVSPFIAKQTKENEIAYERLMDVRLKLVDLSFEIDKNHDAYMRFMQQALNSPDLKMRIGKVIIEELIIGIEYTYPPTTPSSHLKRG